LDTKLDIDEATTQLRKLRERAGLTPRRLASCGSLLSALGTSDPAEGVERLVNTLLGLPDTPGNRALRLDYGLTLSELLSRAATTDERANLGRRRASYADLIRRDVKTLARWSDAAIDDLRPLLINDVVTGDLYVVAAVDGDRIAGVNITERIDQPDGTVKHETTELPNRTPGPTPPMLIYALPRDWQPRNLHLAVVFRGKARPSAVEALHAENLITLPMTPHRYPLDLDADGAASCRIPHPSRHLVYALGWR
jgi:hypothetical protein